MPITVEFKPANMYANASHTRNEIIRLAQEHHQKHLLGKDGRIYNKAVVMHVLPPHEAIYRMLNQR